MAEPKGMPALEPLGGGYGVRQQAIDGVLRDPAALQAIPQWGVPRSKVAAVPEVTALPARALVGDEVDYVADQSAGVLWRFRYRGSGASPWAFVGGPAVVNEVEDQEATTSTSYDDLATDGPTITVALPGDYDVTITALQLSDTANRNQFASYAIGSTAASDDDAAYGVSTTNVGFTLISQTRRKTLEAGTVLLAKYKVSADEGTFERRRLAITPVRVGRG